MSRAAMPRSLQVAVLMGGMSAEAEVSRNSARQVSGALRERGFETQSIELDSQCVATLLATQPDVVFPVLHGPPGEDGTVQGMLSLLGLPYVGSDVRGSALAMDKAIAKQIFRRAGLPVLSDRIIVANNMNLAQQAASVVAELGTALVIKPLNQGSAIGVTPLPHGGDIEGALAAALVYGDCLVEPFVNGREITVGVLESDNGLLPHPVIEIVTPANQWYDFDNRYTPGQSKHLIPAPLPPALQTHLQDIAMKAHTVLGLSDLSRADFLVDADGAITLLEVNTLPGMTPTSLYPEGAAAMGYTFDDLVEHLVVRAVRRGPRLATGT